MRPDRLDIDAHTPVPIDGHQGWRVSAGSVALFRWRSGAEAAAARRPLVDLERDDVVLWQPVATQVDVRLVAIEPAVLAAWDVEAMCHAAATGDTAARAHLRRWVEKFNTEVTRAGSAPLACPETFADAAAVRAWLSQQQTTFLEAVARNDARREAAARERFDARQRLDDELVRETLEGLAAVDRARGPGEPMRSTSPLVTVMRQLGARCGIDVRTPGGQRPESVTVPQILDASGARGRPIVLADRWWTRAGEPLIGTRQTTGEPVGLVPVRRGLWRGAGYDALFGDGPAREVTADLAAELSPAATAVYPPIPAVARARDVIRWAVAGHWRETITAAAAGLGVILLGMVVPQTTKVLFETTIPDGDRARLFSLAAVLLASAAGGLVFDLARSLSFLRLATSAAARFQLGLWDRLLDLGPAFFRRFSVGDLESRVHAVTDLRAALNVSVLAALVAAPASLLNVGLLVAYSPRLTLVALVIAAIAVAVRVGAAVRTRRLLTPFYEADGRVHGLLIELIGAVPKLRIAGAETRAFAQWGRAYAGRVHLAQRLRLLTDRTAVITGALSPLGTAVVFWFAAGDVLSAAPTLSLGGFLAFNAAFGTLLAGVLSLGDNVGLAFTLAAHWARLQPILEADPEVHSQRNPPGRLTGRLRLDRVTFRYRPDGPLTLDNVSLEAAPGECIALVGPSGSGKSTIASMLLRFETPASGAVYLDHHDLKGLDILAVRQQMGVVSQDNRILAGTIFDNIVCGTAATHDQAWEAARAAGIDDEIRAMPMGLHTFVSEGGSNLSGGQRQRLLIARALLRAPVILILDEATSALDNRAQAVVTESLNRLKVTRVLIAHRLSTIRQADRIYVIDAGRVVQQGSFDELMAQDGLFARLMRRQMA